MLNAVNYKKVYRELRRKAQLVADNSLREKKHDDIRKQEYKVSRPQTSKK